MQKAFITNREECLSLLGGLAIQYKLYEHEPVWNME